LKLLIVAFLYTSFFSINAQTIIGEWKTIDDNTGEERAVVRLYKEGNEVYGKIVEVLQEEHKEKICIYCKGENKNKPILGLVIINDLKKDGDSWEGGTILDPESGKVYKCYVTLESPTELKVRGYVGISIFGRTQYWRRAVN
jgi:uncharacterized protein (DUF2147 family)